MKTDLPNLGGGKGLSLHYLIMFCCKCLCLGRFRKEHIRFYIVYTFFAKTELRAVGRAFGHCKKNEM